MFVTSLLTVIVFLAVYYFEYRKKCRDKFGSLNKLPGPRTYPLIGNLWMIILKPREEQFKYISALSEKYGKLFKMWSGTNPLVVCSSAEDAEIILSSRINTKKSTSYDFLIPWLGTGLLISNGSKWHQRRKLLTPAFHFSILESFLPIIARHSRTMVEKLSPLMDKEEEWDIFSFVHRFTFDVICETAMGVTLNIQNNESPAYLESVLSMSNIVIEKVMQPLWHNKYIYSCSNLGRKELKNLKILHGMSMDVIQKSKQKRQERNLEPNVIDVGNDGTKQRKAFLDLLLDIAESSEVPLTDEDIREEVDTFMFWGHDTTTSGILSTIHFLSSHSEIQDKVANELFSVFGDSDRNPSSHDLSKLKYLECVIKESHRLLPPVPSIFRQLTEPVTLGGKYIIPAGTLVDINIFRIHRQDASFPNPEEFNPDNFLPENVHGRHPFAFVPFSAGPRNCIGQKFAILEEKVLMSSLLRKYEIRSSQKVEDLGIVAEIVLRHNNGVRMTMRPRVWNSAKIQNELRGDSILA